MNVNRLLNAVDEAEARYSPPLPTEIEMARKSEREVCARIAESFAQDYPDLAEMAYRIAQVIRRKPKA